MWRRIWRWARGRTSDAGPIRVTLYTREGCHLCEEAEQLLRRELSRYPHRLDLVDIDTSAELVAEYGESVPVVAVAGKVRFRGIVNPVLLRRLLEAECG